MNIHGVTFNSRQRDDVSSDEHSLQCAKDHTLICIMILLIYIQHGLNCW